MYVFISVKRENRKAPLSWAHKRPHRNCSRFSAAASLLLFYVLLFFFVHFTNNRPTAKANSAQNLAKEFLPRLMTMTTRVTERRTRSWRFIIASVKINTNFSCASWPCLYRVSLSKRRRRNGSRKSKRVLFFFLRSVSL